MKKVQLYLQIDRTFSSILFSNPDLNAAFTFTPSSAGGRIYFPSAEMKEETFVPADPVLYTSKRLTFYGPHPSRKKNDDSLVFSLTRTVWDYRGQTMNVYLETNFSQLMDTPSWDQERMNHLIVGQNGNVLFSDIDDGRRLSDFKSFESVSEQGWTIRMLMPLSSYQKVTSAW